MSGLYWRPVELLLDGSLIGVEVNAVIAGYLQEFLKPAYDLWLAGEWVAVGNDLLLYLCGYTNGMKRERGLHSTTAVVAQNTSELIELLKKYSKIQIRAI